MHFLAQAQPVTQGQAGISMLGIILLICIAVLIYSFVSRSKKKNGVIGNAMNSTSVSNISVKSYPVISTISKLFQVFGVLLILAGLMAMQYFSDEHQTALGVILLVVSVFFSIISFGISEIMIVIVDISKSNMGILQQISSKNSDNS